jgi:hypothetical protein
MDGGRRAIRTDHDITAMVNWDDNEDDKDNDGGIGLGLDKMETITNSEGVKALEVALDYTE